MIHGVVKDFFSQLECVVHLVMRPWYHDNPVDDVDLQVDCVVELSDFEILHTGYGVPRKLLPYCGA